LVIGRYNAIQKEKVTWKLPGLRWKTYIKPVLTWYPIGQYRTGCCQFRTRNSHSRYSGPCCRGGQVNLPPEALSDPNAFQQFQANQAGLSSALSRLMVVVEKYPDLKANQNFLTFQSQLEGIEGRIRVERMRYNEAAKLYNQMIVVFPNNLIAGMIGAKSFQFFAAEAEAQKAPSVQFN
jgi:hypothetical protein